MAELKTTRNTDVADDSYLAKPIVYLEGKDDVAFFKDMWFRDLREKIEFKRAAGCTDVVAKVKAAHSAGISQVHGLVDRDALKRQQHWDGFWETDDRIFEQTHAHTFHPNVRVLRRWEVENYMLDADAVNDTVYDRTAGRVHLGQTGALTELMVHWSVLTSVVAANAFFHEHGERELDDGFGLNCHSWLGITKRVGGELKKKTNKWSLKTHLQPNMNRVANFDPGSATTQADRWLACCRCTDGKRLLERIRSNHGIRGSITYSLARLVGERNRLDPEITGFVERLIV